MTDSEKNAERFSFFCRKSMVLVFTDFEEFPEKKQDIDKSKKIIIKSMEILPEM